MAEQALSHIRVIDLTHYLAGPYCTKLMAGFGADVVKIERPRFGDKMRSLGPFYKNKEGLEQSIPFLWLNTGKKSITLNLKTTKGIEIFKALVEDADVVVENFSPRVMPSLGLSYDTLRKINPRLIMTSISNFGQTGPYRDYKAEEIELQALSGGMFMTGDPEKAPLATGPAICQYTAGLHGYIATLMALFHRNLSGKGQFIDVSIQESGLENLEILLTQNLHTGKNSKRGGHLGVPWDLYECKDGYATIIAMPSRNWYRASEIFDDHRLFDKKYSHILDRIKYREEYEGLLKPSVRAHKKMELFQAGQERGLAFGYLASLQEVIESPQHKAREFFVEINHPISGTHRYCGAPFKMSLTQWKSVRAPLLGEHNHIVYGEKLGYLAQEIQHFHEEGVI